MSKLLRRAVGATAAVATAATWAQAPVQADDGPLSAPDAPTTDEVLAMQDRYRLSILGLTG